MYLLSLIFLSTLVAIFVSVDVFLKLAAALGTATEEEAHQFAHALCDDEVVKPHGRCSFHDVQYRWLCQTECRRSARRIVRRTGQHEPELERAAYRSSP